MKTDDPTRTACPNLGQCPRCETTVSAGRLVIDYRHPEEWPRMLAECPNCSEIVAPT